jgi:heme A synthase
MRSGRAEERTPPTALRWIALATCLATYALIVVGGVVRATGSGDACPDWPRCHGELLPPLESDVLIEFSHRLLASLVSFLVLAMAFAAWRWARRDRVIFGGALLAIALVGGQVVLGGITVLQDLHANLVLAHLALGSALFVTLLTVCLASFLPRRAAAPDSPLRNLLVFAALATFALMLTGSYVSGSGAGLAFRDWPLFDGRLMPDAGRLAVIHATHRFAAAAVGVLLAYVALRAWRSRRDSAPVAIGASIAFALYVAQAFVGAANIWTLLQPAAKAAHLALAAALLATLVTTALVAHWGGLPAVEPRRRVETVAAPHAMPGPASAQGPS